jgi:flagellar biosynthesis protein FliR
VFVVLLASVEWLVFVTGIKGQFISAVEVALPFVGLVLGVVVGVYLVKRIMGSLPR